MPNSQLTIVARRKQRQTTHLAPSIPEGPGVGILLTSRRFFVDPHRPHKGVGVWLEDAAIQSSIAEVYDQRQHESKIIRKFEVCKYGGKGKPNLVKKETIKIFNQKNPTWRRARQLLIERAKAMTENRGTGGIAFTTISWRSTTILFIFSFSCSPSIIALDHLGIFLSVKRLRSVLLKPHDRLLSWEVFSIPRGRISKRLTFTNRCQLGVKSEHQAARAILPGNSPRRCPR